MKQEEEDSEIMSGPCFDAPVPTLINGEISSRCGSLTLLCCGDEDRGDNDDNEEEEEEDDDDDDHDRIF